MPIEYWDDHKVQKLPYPQHLLDYDTAKENALQTLNVCNCVYDQGETDH